MYKKCTVTNIGMFNMEWGDGNVFQENKLKITVALLFIRSVRNCEILYKFGKYTPFVQINFSHIQRFCRCSFRGKVSLNSVLFFGDESAKGY